LAPVKSCSPQEDVAQVWSLALHDKASAPSPLRDRLGTPSGCGLSFLDLVDTTDGESLR
jgi:hypothetical protein